MREKKQSLKRRIRPSVPLTLEIDGEKHTFNLAFDMIALGRIEEKTGLNLAWNVFTLWIEMSALRVLATSFWAAALLNHPEYDSDEGFFTLRSLLGPEHEDAVGDALWKAYMLYLPKDERELMQRARKEREEELAKGNPPIPPLPTETAESNTPTSGSNSVPSPDTISDSALANSAG
jgi:hypothetical protein